MSEFLKCDADGCDHVEGVEAITEGHVDMPCPKCGANLLTRDGWEAWQPIQALMKWAEDQKLTGPDAPQPVALRIGLHGQKANIEIELLERPET